MFKAVTIEAWQAATMMVLPENLAGVIQGGIVKTACHHGVITMFRCITRCLHRIVDDKGFIASVLQVIHIGRDTGRI